MLWLQIGLSLDIPSGMSRRISSRYGLSRREFIARALAVSSTAALWRGGGWSCLAAERTVPPIVVFSKPKTRGALVKALRESGRVLKQWLEEAQG